MLIKRDFSYTDPTSDAGVSNIWRYVVPLVLIPLFILAIIGTYVMRTRRRTQVVSKNIIYQQGISQPVQPELPNMNIVNILVNGQSVNPNSPEGARALFSWYAQRATVSPDGVPQRQPEPSFQPMNFQAPDYPPPNFEALQASPSQPKPTYGQT